MVGGSGESDKVEVDGGGGAGVGSVASGGGASDVVGAAGGGAVVGAVSEFTIEEDTAEEMEERMDEVSSAAEVVPGRVVAGTASVSDIGRDKWECECAE